MEKWKELILAFLRDFFSKNEIQHKEYDDLGLWLSRYFNFRLKFIPIKKWQLRISRELSVKLNLNTNRDACFDIFHRAANGININPYQSKGLRNADMHDRLFNDWGIHHLHLSITKNKPNDFFLKRSDYLLLVKFSDDIVYFIGIFEHKKRNVWSLTECIRILQENWPDLMKPYETTAKFLPNLNDEEIGILRRKGYSFGINVGNKSYTQLNHGYAVSGDNMAATMQVGEVIRWGYKNRHIAESDEAAFIAELKKHLWIS